MKWKTFGVYAVLLIFGGLNLGCEPLIRTVMIDSPNKGVTVESLSMWDGVTEQVLGLDQIHRIEVDGPKASILVGVLDPVSRPKATILMMHGFRNSFAWIISEARRMTQAGYRVVLVDLRGHGGSSGDVVSYGVVEARDVSLVLDAMVAKGIVIGPVGVWGESLGGTAAIQVAGQDRRIKAVVAVMPFVSLRQVVPGLVRRGLPVAGWMMTDQQIQLVVDRCAEVGGFDADEAEARTAIRQTSAPVYIAHGTWDQIVPFDHSVQLQREAPDRVVLEKFSGGGHFSLGLDFSGEVIQRAIDWFDQHLIAANENL